MTCLYQSGNDGAWYTDEGLYYCYVKNNALESDMWSAVSNSQEILLGFAVDVQISPFEMTEHYIYSPMTISCFVEAAPAATAVSLITPQ